MIEFTVQGIPVSQGRPRATRIGHGVRMYDPPKSKNYKTQVALIGRQHAPKELITEALQANIKIYRQIPKSETKRFKELANARITRPIVNPDVDNYVKAIFDALNGIIYKDDSQIVDLYASKFYSDNPRVEVRFSLLD